MATPRSLTDRIFRDTSGKIVVAQLPNIPLAVWIICSILTRLFQHGQPHAGLHLLAQSALFTWAYLELRYGVNLFRHALGAVALATMIIPYFR